MSSKGRASPRAEAKPAIARNARPQGSKTLRLHYLAAGPTRPRG
jgi:hypothetical protein